MFLYDFNNFNEIIKSVNYYTFHPKQLIKNA